MTASVERIHLAPRERQVIEGLADGSTLAVSYATESISPPKLLDPESLYLPREQRELVPLIAQGMATARMATELKRPVDIIRRDGRELLANLRARNRTHTIKRAWEHQVLTTDQVIAWL